MEPDFETLPLYWRMPKKGVQSPVSSGAPRAPMELLTSIRSVLLVLCRVNLHPLVHVKFHLLRVVDEEVLHDVQGLLRVVPDQRVRHRVVDRRVDLRLLRDHPRRVLLPKPKHDRVRVSANAFVGLLSVHKVVSKFVLPVYPAAPVPNATHDLKAFS